MNVIGLKQGTVKLVPHNPQWKLFFEVEAKRILNGFKNWALPYDIKIHHIGSTAVPNIYAKPIIDILIGVEKESDIYKTQATLEQLNYIFRVETSEEDRMFFVLGNAEKRTHHIHVVEYQGTRWNNDVLFVNYLNTHPEQAQKYNVLKNNLANQYPNDRKNYTFNKTTFIQETLVLAKHWENNRHKHTSSP